MSVYAGVRESCIVCRNRGPGAASAGHQAQRCARRLRTRQDRQRDPARRRRHRRVRCQGGPAPGGARRPRARPPSCTGAARHRSRPGRRRADACRQRLLHDRPRLHRPSRPPRAHRDARRTIVDVAASVDEYLEKKDWRVNANANQGYSLGGLILNVSGKVVANYWLSHVYAPEIGEAHRNADVHIHDLDMLAGYCAGWSLRLLLHEGLNGVPGKVEAGPPKHMGSAVGQIVNFLGTLQNEWAGAQAFSSFDTYMAPFIRKDAMTFPGGEAVHPGADLQPERAVALGHADAVHEPDFRLGVSGRPSRPDPGDRRARRCRSHTATYSPRWT